MPHCLTFPVCYTVLNAIITALHLCTKATLSIFMITPSPCTQTLDLAHLCYVSIFLAVKTSFRLWAKFPHTLILFEFLTVLISSGSLILIRRGTPVITPWFHCIFALFLNFNISNSHSVFQALSTCMSDTPNTQGYKKDSLYGVTGNLIAFSREVMFPVLFVCFCLSAS